MLKITHLTKKYGEKIAVDDVSLEIPVGTIYGFIGHNGAGKTTTIKCCCGLLRFEEGEIMVDNISVKENPLACKERLSYLPDNPDLYNFMTGIKYLNFIADIYRMEKTPSLCTDVRYYGKSWSTYQQLLPRYETEIGIDIRFYAQTKVDSA